MIATYQLCLSLESEPFALATYSVLLQSLYIGIHCMDVYSLFMLSSFIVEYLLFICYWFTHFFDQLAWKSKFSVTCSDGLLMFASHYLTLCSLFLISSLILPLSNDWPFCLWSLIYVYFRCPLFLVFWISGCFMVQVNHRLLRTWMSHMFLVRQLCLAFHLLKEVFYLACAA